MAGITTDKEWLHSNETLEDSFKKLCSKLRALLPNIFGGLQENLPMIRHEGGVSITLPLLPQQEMSDFLTLIEEKLNVNILYAIKKDGGQYYEAMAYSNPVAGQLYTFIMRSYLHGIVKSVDVQLYDSYEPMFTQVRQALDELQNVKADRILEKEDVPTLYAHFFK